MTDINDIPEHVERVLLRPLIENFCTDYVTKKGYDSFLVKVVEYNPKLLYGIADTYFLLPKSMGGNYIHIVLKIPIKKLEVDGKTKLHLMDPVIDKSDFKKPYK
jgi:hypothetical protein